MSSFEKQFQDRLDSIERRARVAGVTLTHLCRESKLSRATPDRWRAEAPQSIKLVDKLEAALVAFEKEAGIIVDENPDAARG